MMSAGVESQSRVTDVLALLGNGSLACGCHA